MPILSFIFISILLIGSFPSITSACSCAELPSVEEGFDRSQAVFSGKVVDVREKRSLKGYITKSVLFEVTNTWKGVEQSQIIITTGQGGGNCGFDFKEGQEYLVNANELSSSQEDLEVLNEGQPSIEKVDLMDNHEGNQLYIWVAVVVAIGIILTFRFKRRKNLNEK